jgi:cell division protease FtsH
LKEHRLDKFKKILWPIAIGLLIGVVAAYFTQDVPERGRDALATEMEAFSSRWFAQEHNLSAFADDLRNGKVTTVGIGIEYALVSAGKDSRYYVRIDTQRPLFLDLLKEKSSKLPTIVSLGDIEPVKSPMTKAMGWLSLSNLLPLTFVVLTALILVQMLGLNESRRLFKRVVRPTTRFSDIIGAEEAKEAVQDLVAYLRNPKQFSTLGATAPHGIILAGPPGTGKTRLAQAMAGEAGCGFIPITGSDFTDKFVGNGVKRVRKLMEVAKKQAPTVIFIDEIDAIGTRTSGGDAVSTENNRIINALLVALDGFTANDGIIVVGATNSPERLDPALVREGRFDRTCYTALPTIGEREQLFGMYVSKLTVHPVLDIRQLARLSAGMSPAAIATVTNSAALLAGKEHAKEVTQDHLLRALEKQSMGSPTHSGKDAMSEAVRRRVAVHEAGHAVYAVVQDLGVLEKVSILPRRAAGGVTWVTEDDDVSLYTEQQLRKRMGMLLAGRGAELLLLDDTSTGASDDLKRVTGIAHQMVTRFGFSKVLGALSYDGLPSEAQRSSIAAPDVMAETRALIGEAESLMRATLTTYRKALELVATYLEEQETIDGRLVKQCIEQTDPHRTEAIGA